jgi:hypothetical protein
MGSELTPLTLSTVLSLLHLSSAFLVLGACLGLQLLLSCHFAVDKDRDESRASIAITF